MRRLGFLVVAFVLVASVAAAHGSLRCDPDCNVRVTTVQGPANEVALAVNPADPANVIAAAKDYTYGQDGRECDVYRVWAGLYHSRDGGRTWSEQLLAPPPGDYDCISDPVLAFGPHGTAYFAGLGIGRGPNGLFVSRSTDGGATWTHAGTVPDSGDPDKEWAAVDPVSGRLWLAWIDTRGYFLRVARSDDRGATWVQSTVPALGARAPSIAVGPPNALGTPVYVAWYDLSAAVVQFAASYDDGQTWLVRPAAPLGSTGDEVQTRPFRNHAFPSIGVHPSAGTVYIAYPDLAQSLGEIRVVRTVGADLAWGPPVSVDVSPLTDEMMPQLAVSPSGAVDVAYYSYANGLLDVRYSNSTDGLRWDPPLRVTTASSDPEFAYHQNGFTFIGDYIGAAAAPGAAYAAWADMRNVRSDVYFAAVRR